MPQKKRLIHSGTGDTPSMKRYLLANTAGPNIPDTPTRESTEARASENKSESTTPPDRHVRDDTPVTLSVKPKKTTVTQRTFQQKWLTLYPWLDYCENIGMTCKICKSGGRNNVYVTGCKNYRVSSITEHSDTSDHRKAIKVPSLKSAFEKATQKALTDKEESIIVALKTLYWMVQENIPLMKFESFVTLLNDLHTPRLSDLRISQGVEYTSAASVHGFLSALNHVIEEKTIKKLCESPYVAVLTDKSTDRVVNKRLIIYAKVCDKMNMRPSTLFVSNVNISDGTGKGISNVIYNEMEQRKVAPEKIMGLGSDGASVMTGKKTGVTGMMMQKNPIMVNVHCVAHRLALCTSQAAANVAGMQRYQQCVTDIFYYFKYSTNRVAHLKAIQEILESPRLKFREVHAVRWLAFYEALEVVYRLLDVLLTYLQEHGSTKDPKALGLKKKAPGTKYNIACLMQKRRNSIANTLELHLFCIKPSIPYVTNIVTWWLMLWCHKIIFYYNFTKVYCQR